MIKQLQLSTLVIINKQNEVNETELNLIKKEINNFNPEVQIFTSNFCKIDISLILNQKFFINKINSKLLSNFTPVTINAAITNRRLFRPT